jgi:hypothetical protein
MKITMDQDKAYRYLLPSPMQIIVIALIDCLNFADCIQFQFRVVILESQQSSLVPTLDLKFFSLFFIIGHVLGGQLLMVITDK